jgi:Cdc6-like AAA superfamily ATPase
VGGGLDMTVEELGNSKEFKELLTYVNNLDIDKKFKGNFESVPFPKYNCLVIFNKARDSRQDLHYQFDITESSIVTAVHHETPKGREKYKESLENFFSGKTRQQKFKRRQEFESLDKAIKGMKNLITEVENVLSEKENSMEQKLEQYVALLEANRNLILTGAPGTGKTRLAKDFAEYLICGSITEDKKKQADNLAKSSQFKLIQFHPAYSYEDFVRGIVAETKDEKVSYKVENKILGKIAKEAANAGSENKYVLIIDEINRANLPAVLGELIYALEYRGQKVESMYGLDIKYENGSVGTDNSLVLPDNLYIIGTMNTADRSTGQIDYAIRRRFAFYPVLPKKLNIQNFAEDLFEKVSKLFVKEIKDNIEGLEREEKYLSSEFKPEDVWLGHSYFIANDKKTRELRLEYEIKPILREYLKDGILTPEAKKIIDELE